MQKGIEADETKKPVKLLELQHKLIKDLWHITQGMHRALEEKDLDGFSQDLDRRQGAFIRIMEVQQELAPFIQIWRDTGKTPSKIAWCMEENKNMLNRILELDKTCQSLGEAFKASLGEGLGEARAKKRIQEGYGPSPQKATSRFFNGKA